MDHPIIMSVDVEDWQQSTWDRSLPVSKISAENTIRLLDIFEEYKIKSTMFIQGKFSEKFPNIVKRIHKSGHEVACHGHGHVEIFRQKKNDFILDVTRAKENLENIIGEPVIGYRAPDFSVIKDTLWVLEKLCELNFKYDSSIFPIKHNRYGISDWPIEPKKINLSNQNSLIEFPISIFKIRNYNLPVGGGGYFRLFPKGLFNLMLKKIIKKRPFIFYMHPYELNHLELNNLNFKVPLSTRLHQGLGRKYFSKKLKYLIKSYEISNFKTQLKNYDLDSFDYLKD